MSTRQIRRLQEQLQSAKLKKNKSEDEDDDFQPLYVHNHKISYDLLTPEYPIKPDEEQESDTPEIINDGFSVLFTDSPDEDDDEEVASDDSPGPTTTQKKKKNNRKKKNKRNRRNENQASSSAQEEMPETDEIERAVAEVNSILGEPQRPAPAQTALDDAGFGALLKVNHKHLSPEDEFTRRFGRDDEEQKRNQRPDMLRLCRRHIVLPSDTALLNINGLSMKQINQQGDVKYFKYMHSTKYQSAMRELIANMKFRLESSSPEYNMFPITTVEAAIQNVDLYFMLEEATAASKLLEALILFLQNNFCPSFNYVDGKTRLIYKHVENRPFHILLLKYIYFNTNKACHRTALEIAKLLLSLDPSDPLAVIFIIDTLALRAREHKWLVDIYQHWETERDVGVLFHMVYSHALARYHLYLKSKKQGDSELAEFYLRDAFRKYPNVAVMLLAHCNIKNPTVTEHKIFTCPSIQSPTSMDMRDLQMLYVKFAGPKWREGKTMKWFVDVAIRLTQDYDSDPGLQAAFSTATTARNSLFRKYPIEISRHLAVVRAMSSLLIDGDIPSLLETYAFNPYPFDGIAEDSPGYWPPWSPTSGWRFFLESLFRDTNDYNG